MARLLLDAIRSGDVSLAKDIIQKEAYGGIDSQTSRRDGTSLFFCCSRGYLDLAILLLNKNANINARNKCLATPLHAAADNNHLRILSLLLDRGADINARTQRGDTPLHLAGFRGHADIAQCLVERGADLLLPNDSNMTPAVEAFSRGHLEVGQYLNAVNELYGPSSSKRKLSSDRMVRLDPPSPISQQPPLSPIFLHNGNNKMLSKTAVPELSCHTNQHRVTSRPTLLRHVTAPSQSPLAQSRPQSVSSPPATDIRGDAMNDYLFQNRPEVTTIHTHALSKNTNKALSIHGPPEQQQQQQYLQYCQTNPHHYHESLRSVGDPSPDQQHQQPKSGYSYPNHHHQHEQQQQLSTSDFCNELPVNLKRNSATTTITTTTRLQPHHPKEPEEDVDYNSIIYFPPSATLAFPSNNLLPKTPTMTTATNDIPYPCPHNSLTLPKTHSSSSFPLSPSVINTHGLLEPLQIAPHNDNNRVLCSDGSDVSSSYYGDARRDDFDVMHNALYQPENHEQEGDSNDYTMQPVASSLRHHTQANVYNRLPSTPSSIASMELLDPFESAVMAPRYNNGGDNNNNNNHISTSLVNNSNQRTASPMSVEILHSSPDCSGRFMETSAKLSCGSSDDDDALVAAAVGDNDANGGDGLNIFRSNQSNLPCASTNDAVNKGCLWSEHDGSSFTRLPKNISVCCSSRADVLNNGGVGSDCCISMNDLSSITSPRPVSSNSTVLSLNIPVGDT